MIVALGNQSNKEISAARALMQEKENKHGK